MRTLLPLAAVLALVGCSGGTTDTFEPTPDTDDTDPPVDADEDGFSVEDDCDDDDPDVNPGKAEVCDEKDNDCDGNVDEGFDDDGDQHYSAALCPFGTDCDDRDDDINPDAPEVPYDGVDQDCDGADLCDVDGDGFLADEGSCGGDDCLDDDATAFPGGTEIPYDGIDQDCSGADLLDADLDGHDSADFGGDDCDDADPRINPSRMDWLNDGIDSDCDRNDGRDADLRLRDAPITISGTLGYQEWLGFDLVACDMDGDDIQDLLVSHPLGNSYAGNVGLFRGQYADLWDADMLISDADTLFQGTGSNQFFGMMLACDDIDGDGNDDLLVGKSEIYGGSFNRDLELRIFNGSGSALSSLVPDTRADAAWTADLITASTGATTLYSLTVELGDLDGDGKAEIILGISKSWPEQSVDEVWIIPGKLYKGEDLLEDIDHVTLTMADAADVDGAGLGLKVLPDLDGDGKADLAVYQSGYQLEPEPETGEPTTEGRVLLISGIPEADATLEDAAYASLVGDIDQGFGSDVHVADVDGSGALDLIVGAFLDDSQVEDGGAVLVFQDPPAFSGTATWSSELDATLTCDSEVGLLGVDLFPVSPDVDGDGRDDFVARQRNFDTFDGTSDDRIHLVGGGLLPSGAEDVEAADLAWFDREFETARTGQSLIADDIDGDGIFDMLIGAPYTETVDGFRTGASGQVYIYLSNDMPWGYTMGIPEE